MKWVFALAAALLLATAPARTQSVTAEIKAHCAAEWAGDYAMQKWCLDRQIAAANKLGTLIDQNPPGTEGYKILGRCFAEWPSKSGETDYAMALWCADRQFKAYKALQ